MLHVSEWLEVPTLVNIFDLLGVVPKSLAPTLVDHLGVKVVPFPRSIPHVPIFAVWHEARRQDPARQWLRKVCAPNVVMVWAESVYPVPRAEDAVGRRRSHRKQEGEIISS